MHIDDVKGVARTATRPAGNREFQGALHQSEKAVCVLYYDWNLWIPKKAVRRCNGTLSAPGWAIEKAKEFQRKRQGRVAVGEEDLSVG